MEISQFGQNFQLNLNALAPLLSSPAFPAIPLPSAAVSVNGPTECPERWRRRCRRPDRLKGREKGKGNFIQKGGFPLPLSPANSVQACGDARTKFYSLRFPAQNEKDPLVSPLSPCSLPWLVPKT